MCQERGEWDSRNILSKAKMAVPRMFALNVVIIWKHLANAPKRSLREEPVVGQLSRISGN